MTILHEPAPRSPALRSIDERVRRIIDVHFDPLGGAAYWLERAESLGIDPRRDVRTARDLALLGDSTPESLGGRPLIDFIPRRFHDRLDRFIVGQTGGTTGGGTWTAYREDEFDAAFVTPFVLAAAHVGFPRGEPWLYVGPGGPHVIGKAARRLAQQLEAPDPFSVDFDPRWAKRLPEGSIALRRYLDHVVEQAIDVLDAQRVGVIFTTPAVLDRLAETMTKAARRRIRGVHYGGMALDPARLLRFQEEAFPDAVHLSGYGNTLFGCCLELEATSGRSLDYFPCGERIVLEVVNEGGALEPPGVRGRVRFTRLDESMLIVRMVERDEASPVAPPAHAPPGYVSYGVRDPAPAPGPVPLRIGLY